MLSQSCGGNIIGLLGSCAGDAEKYYWKLKKKKLNQKKTGQICFIVRNLLTAYSSSPFFAFSRLLAILQRVSSQSIVSYGCTLITIFGVSKKRAKFWLNDPSIFVPCF